MLEEKSDLISNNDFNMEKNQVDANKISLIKQASTSNKFEYKITAGTVTNKIKHVLNDNEAEYSDYETDETSGTLPNEEISNTESSHVYKKFRESSNNNKKKNKGNVESDEVNREEYYDDAQLNENNLDDNDLIKIYSDNDYDEAMEEDEEENGIQTHLRKKYDQPVQQPTVAATTTVSSGKENFLIFLLFISLLISYILI